MSLTDPLCLSYVDLQRQFDPAAASAAGERAHDARPGRFDAEGVRQHTAALRSIAGAVEELDVTELEDEIDRTALLDDIRLTIDRLERTRPYVRNPALWFDHVCLGLYSLVAREPESAEQAQATAEAALARLEALPEFLAAASRTVSGPLPLFLETALDLRVVAETLVHETVARFAPVLEDRAEVLLVAAERARVALAEAALAMRDAGAGATAHTFALGEDEFNHELHLGFALGTSAPELWRYALHWREELNAEIRNLAHELGAGDHPRAAAEHLVMRRPDLAPAIPPWWRDDRDAALEAWRTFNPQGYLAARRQGRPQSPQDSGPIAPGFPPGLGISTLPVFLIPSGQVAAQQAGRSAVRRLVPSPLTVQGWSLYGIDLLERQQPDLLAEERLFHRFVQLWHALMLSLDVGLHTGRLTVEDAIELLVAHFPLERSRARGEVRRLAAAPTMGTAAAAGRREILRTLEAWREREGPDADHAFHDRLLSYGGIPIPLARWGMALDVEG